MARYTLFALLIVPLLILTASCRTTSESLTSDTWTDAGQEAGDLLTPPVLPVQPEASAKETIPGVETIKRDMSLQEQEEQYMTEHFFRVGKAHFARHEYIEAEKNFKLAVQLSPNNEKAREFLYRTQSILGKRYPAYETVKEDLAKRARALVDQEVKELERDYNAARRLFEKGEFERAKKMFEICLERIRWFPYPIDTVKDYERLCNRRILDCDKRARDQKIRERQEKEVIAQRMAEQEESKIAEQRKLKIELLFQRITDALYLGNFKRAEELCAEILREDPDNTMAKKLQKYAVRGRHAYVNMQILKETKEQKKRVFEELSETKVPYQDVIRFPDRDKWVDIVCQRMPGVTTEIEEEPIEIQHIKRILETRTVTLSFQDTPLSEVVSFLQDITGLNISIDPRIDKEVTLTLRLRDIILKNALQLIVDQTEYMYIFKENVIWITEKSPITGKGILEIYNVSDVLAKIPQFQGPDVRVWDPESGGGGGGGAGGGGLSFEENEETEGEPFGPDELIELIKAATGEEVWPEEEGGFGTIEHHRGQLIIINTREMHIKVQKILENLRKNTGIFVMVEIRFIEVTNDFLEDIGIDYRGLGNGGSILGAPFTMVPNSSGGTDSGIAKRIPTPQGENIAARVQNSFDGFP
ncbi:MAG: hypothetical protein ABIH42_00955, partial [Planctomycetota bacterium]